MKYYTPTRISENIHETPEGFLLCIGVAIARTGEMEYGQGETPLEAGKDGKVTITRLEGEVFRAETIASFEGKPVTILHPEDFVSPENWKELAKGIIQNVRRGAEDQKDDLIADLLITDSVAIALVKNGLREVSCGYEAEYTQTGEGRGTQSGIIGNHLALVEQGRAGSSYAINDHKGKGAKMSKKFSEKLKALFAKTVDEAAKEMDEASEEKKPDEKAKDASAYDELVQMCKDLGEKVSALAGAKPMDAEKKPEEKPAEEKKADDAEAPAAASASLEERLKALELAVAKLSESESMEAGDEDEEESEDAKEDEEKEDSKDEMPEMTGDTRARIEILAPGLKPTKDAKAKALKVAFDTTEGKKVIESLTGGKAPTFDSAEKVDTLFIAASELLKAQRSGSLSKTKTQDFQSNLGLRDGAMTPERMNEINAKHFGLK